MQSQGNKRWKQRARGQDINRGYRSRNQDEKAHSQTKNQPIWRDGSIQDRKQQVFLEKGQNIKYLEKKARLKISKEQDLGSINPLRTWAFQNCLFWKTAYKLQLTRSDDSKLSCFLIHAIMNYSPVTKQQHRTLWLHQDQPWNMKLVPFKHSKGYRNKREILPPDIPERPMINNHSEAEKRFKETVFFCLATVSMC